MRVILLKSRRKDLLLRSSYLTLSPSPSSTMLREWTEVLFPADI